MTYRDHPSEAGKAVAAPASKNDEQERNAMRAFLQRSEVRLSTMHRVAVGFISGAGLLFLLPVFFKDSILTLLRSLLTFAGNLPPEVLNSGPVLALLLYLALLVPFLLSVLIPIFALLMLLRDIVRFYFTGHAPGFPEEHFTPRFALTGVAFSPDESENVKNKVKIHQYGSDLIHFIVPFAEEESKYFSDVIDRPERHIVPKSRKLPRLIKHGVLENATDKPLSELTDEDPLWVSHRHDGQVVLPEARKRAVKDIDRFNAALGLSGFVDRSLYEEVAKQEVSLVRHSLNLRRMVLRYFQALLILMATMLVSFTLLPFIDDDRFPKVVVFAVGYFIWALITVSVANLPVRWLVSYFPKETRHAAIERLKGSDGLEQFAVSIQLTCQVSMFISFFALVGYLFVRNMM
jgi:hypothetical protein